MTRKKLSSSQTTESPSLAVVGVLPPPFGGVSVHVKRYLDLLRRHGVQATLYEQTGKADPQGRVVPLSNSVNRFLRFLFTFREDVVHFQFNNEKALVLAGKLLKLRPRKKYLITIHSEKLVRRFNEKGWLYRKAIGACLRGANHLICVNTNIYNFMAVRLAIDPAGLSVIPAFLPPTEEEKDPRHIPDCVQRFLVGREKVIGTHGWFGYFVEGNHVYSFDHVAKLAKEIADSGRNIAIYTVISGCYEEQHREKIRKLQKQLADHWMIVEHPFSCAALYKKTDLFIRPTVTDGDSVSVRECLSMGVPVLASDSVPRPQGCTTYPSRDYEALSRSFWNCLDYPEQSIGRADQDDFSCQLVDIIVRLLENR